MNKRLIDIKLWMSNLMSFIQDTMTKLELNSQKSLDKTLICNEYQEALTKTRIQLITQFFKYLLALDNKSLKWHLNEFESGCDF